MSILPYVQKTLHHRVNHYTFDKLYQSHYSVKMLLDELGPIPDSPEELIESIKKVLHQKIDELTEEKLHSKCQEIYGHQNLMDLLCVELLSLGEASV